MDVADYKLLREYVRGSRAGHPPSAAAEAAFSELARRYVDMVYSAAVRQCRDGHDAADVTQAVFIALARKAETIAPRVILAGWLLNAVRFAAAELRRREKRLKIRERKVAMAQEIEYRSRMAGSGVIAQGGADESHEFAPVLDEALAELGEGYRAAVLLRYFEGKDYPQTAAALGLTEPAARQRVSRAVEKMRGLLARRGVKVTAGAVTAALAQQASSAAEPELVAAVCAAPSAGGDAASALAEAAHWAMRSRSAVTAAALVGLAIVVVTAAGWIVARTVLAPLGPNTVLLVTRSDVRVAKSPPAAAPAPAPAAPAPPGPRYRSPRATVGEGIRPIEIPTGAVLAPDGSPIEGAEVYLVDSQRPLWVYFRQYYGGLSQISGRGGSFAFPPQEYEPWQVVVCHERGFGRATAAEIKSGGRVVISPWARVEGTLRDGSGPVAGKVHLSLPRLSTHPLRSQLILEFGVPTDERGGFVIPQVVPGEVWISREFDAPVGGQAYPIRTIVRPGEAARVDVTPRGAVVSGRLSVPPGVGADVGWPATEKLWTVGRMRPVADPAILPPTLPLKIPPQDATEASYEAWETSDSARRLKAAGFAHTFLIRPDGSFRAEGLPPGRYDISVSTLEREDPAGAPDTIGRASATVTVPETASDGTEVPAGVVSWRPTDCLRIGKLAPAVAGIGAAGQPVSLSDCRGNFVLCYVDSAGATPSADLAAAQELARRFPAVALPATRPAISPAARAPGLIVLRLGVDTGTRTTFEMSTLRREQTKVLPPVTEFGDMGGSVRPGEAFFIGPDGTVLAKHLRGRKLLETVTAMVRPEREGGSRDR